MRCDLRDEIVKPCDLIELTGAARGREKNESDLERAPILRKVRPLLYIETHSRQLEVYFREILFGEVHCLGEPLRRPICYDQLLHDINIAVLPYCQAMEK